MNAKYLIVISFDAVSSDNIEKLQKLDNFKYLIDIDYNLTEVFPTKSWHNQLIMSALSGSIKYQLDLNKRFGYLIRGISQPALDNFVHEASKYTISKHKSNLLLIHYTDVDTNRHYHGYDSKEANDALIRHDKRLGEIIETLKENNIFYDSTIDFWILAMAVGSAQGGIQAISISFFAKMVPKENANEFFGFYNIFGKFAAIMGPFLVAIITQATGETRNGILSLIILFVVGFACLIKVREE